MMIQNRKKIPSETSTSLNTPVLILIYNRPDTTRHVFADIKKAKPSSLYIAADGQRAEYPNSLLLWFKNEWNH